jgi:outer membrane protein assembly factor BamB
MTTPVPPPSPKLRWKFPVVVIALAILAILSLHHREWVESYVAAYATGFVCALTYGLLCLWFAFFSGLRPRTRLRGSIFLLALTVGILVAVKTTTRIEGTISGVGVPRLVWRWSPHAGQNTPALTDVTIDASHPVDLTKTTDHDFAQFLGPTRSNSITGIHLDRDWTAHPPKKLWSRPVGLGWGSFAVVGDWAVTQEQRGQNELTVCYDILTGQPRWEFSHPNTRFSEWQGGDGPRATPTIDAGRVYAMGATGLLDCLDGATGKAIWSRNVMTDTHSTNIAFGKSCSPLVTGDLVIVTPGHGVSLVAYHKSDGSPAWTGGKETSGYASPMLATLGGVRQILTINSDSAAAHDLADGKLLWRYPWPGSLPKVPSPVSIGNDRVLISCGYGIGCVVLQIHNDNGQFSVIKVWNNRFLKPKFADLALRDGYIYGLDDAILTCLDLSTGKRQWRGENYGFGQLLLVDDLLLIQCEDGNVALVEASPSTYRELTRFTALSSKTWNNPVLSGHKLLVRNDQEAACFELP